MKSKIRRPSCIVIAGPNGAGKTTFAREFLPREAGIVRFVNADLIAAGLSPLKPELAALTAGRLVLSELDRLASAQNDFAFESTLSGLTYAARLKKWKEDGYRVEIVFLKLASVKLALQRIADRVKQGGHSVSADAVRRRLTVAGKTLKRPTAIWQTLGRYMITLEKNANSSRKDHEKNTETQTEKHFGEERRTRAQTGGQTGSHHRAPSRHPHPCAIQRRGRGAQAVAATNALRDGILLKTKKHPMKMSRLHPCPSVVKKACGK